MLCVCNVYVRYIMCMLHVCYMCVISMYNLYVVCMLHICKLYACHVCVIHCCTYIHTRLPLISEELHPGGCSCILVSHSHVICYQKSLCKQYTELTSEEGDSTHPLMSSCTAKPPMPSKGCTLDAEAGNSKVACLSSNCPSFSSPRKEACTKQPLLLWLG